VGVGDSHARFLEPIRAVCDEIRARVVAALVDGHVPLVLGGDQSIAIGTVTGVAEHFRTRSEKLGLIWVDAHADMNTPETSPSGNIHGMPLAALLGLGASELVGLGGFTPKVDPENVCLVGIRNLDDNEKRIVRESGIHAYTMREIDERGMLAVVREAIGHASRGTGGFHVSFDIDGMDPTAAPGVGTPVKGGINWREAQLFAETVADSGLEPALAPDGATVRRGRTRGRRRPPGSMRPGRSCATTGSRPSPSRSAG
jgi:arginase